jgi:hypothetical protein
MTTDRIAEHAASYSASPWSSTAAAAFIPNWALTGRVAWSGEAG